MDKEKNTLDEEIEDITEDVETDETIDEEVEISREQEDDIIEEKDENTEEEEESSEEIIEKSSVEEDDDYKKEFTEESIDEIFEKDKSFKKKIIIFSGTILVLLLLFSLMYYFFYKRVDLQMNISTDKKFEFVYFDGEKTQFTTQRYISDLGYSMRHDVENFEVFKYKEQDIYKCITNSEIVLSVEKTSIPKVCNVNIVRLDSAYNNCEVTIDDAIKEYYIYDKKDAYKVTISIPPELKEENNYGDIIERMITTFKIGNEE